jgi:hypothetical protein
MIFSIFLYIFHTCFRQLQYHINQLVKCIFKLLRPGNLGLSMTMHLTYHCLSLSRKCRSSSSRSGNRGSGFGMTSQVSGDNHEQS